MRELKEVGSRGIQLTSNYQRGIQLTTPDLLFGDLFVCTRTRVCVCVYRCTYKGAVYMCDERVGLLRKRQNPTPTLSGFC